MGAILADDIRTLATNKDTISTQAKAVTAFIDDNGHQINLTKTKVLAFTKTATDFKVDTINICDENMAMSSSACYLGYWWHRVC